MLMTELLMWCRGPLVVPSTYSLPPPRAAGSCLWNGSVPANLQLPAPVAIDLVISCVYVESSFIVYL